jgi:neutral ceramidase
MHCLPAVLHGKEGACPYGWIAAKQARPVEKKFCSRSLAGLGPDGNARALTPVTRMCGSPATLFLFRVETRCTTKSFDEMTVLPILCPFRIASFALARSSGPQSGHRIVLVNADIHIFTRGLHREIVKAARERFGLRESEIMLIATHTHSGPALPSGFEPRISWALDEGEMRKLLAAADRIREQVLDAMARALSNLQPARLAFGRGESAFGVNRRVLGSNGEYDFGSNPAGISDPDVPVLLVESPKGAPLAVVFTYACHCTTIRNGQEGFYKYHPDYAGIAAEELERRLAGATALYATGCAGDIDSQPQAGVKQAELHARSLSAVVLKIVGRGRLESIRGPLQTSYREIGLPLAAIPSRQKYVELSASQIAYRQRHARFVLAQMDAGNLPTEVPLPIQVWQFGKDLTLVAMAGEVCVDYALRLKRELGAARTWPVAYANEVPCYIPSERILKEGGYEAGWDGDQGPAFPEQPETSYSTAGLLHWPLE